MKKIFIIPLSFILFTSTAVLAQSGTKTAPVGSTKEMLRFGGNINGSTVSIMQVIDYPVLQLPEDDQTVVSFEFAITAAEAQGKIIKVESAKLNRETLDYLREFVDEKGKITIRNVITQKGEVILETPYRLELNFSQ